MTADRGRRGRGGLRGGSARPRALAELDPLTGALNRRGPEKLAERLFTGGQGPGPSVICLDLDDFKLVNDRHGHAAGDELLRWTVAAVRDVLRTGDAVGSACAPGDGDSLDALTQAADRRLYREKQHHHGTVGAHH